MKKRILFIDDDPDYLSSTSLFLKKKYEVITAESAEEGWEKLKKEKFDLIILDAMMRPQSGFTMAEKLKVDPELQNIPIVMLTGVVPYIPNTKYSSDDILRFKGEEFVEKSEGLEKLLSVIEKLLE